MKNACIPRNHHRRFVCLLGLLLLMIMTRYAFQIDLPRLAFLGMIGLIALLGDQDEITAMIIACIPLHESIDFFYALVLCTVVYVCKFYRQIRLGTNVLLVLVIILPILILLFLRLSVAPVVQELAKARVDNRASYVINEAVETLLREDRINYQNIILLEKDVNGTVTALKTNMSEINHLKTQILSVIDVLLLDMDINEIGLPLGSVFLPELFSGTGPKLPVKVMSISRSDAEFRNEFKEAGINQTLQQIMMDVIITMTILTPVGTETVTTVSEVVVAETVVVGNVPDSYVNVDG